MTVQRAGESPVTDPQWSLELFGSWRLSRTGTVHSMRTREQRLVALLALQGVRRRSYVAGVLWPESTEAHAGASLRAATCRIDQIAPGLLLHDRRELSLSTNLRVDVRDFVDYVWRISAAQEPAPAIARDAATCLPLLLHGDLLPGWYDDWVIYERARLQQLRIQALEVTAARLIERGDTAAALIAASEAVAIEPLRESSQRVLIRIHLHDGNYHAALRDYRAFHSRIQRELGIAPSGQLQALVRPLLRRRHATASGGTDLGYDLRPPATALAMPGRPASRPS